MRHKPASLSRPRFERELSQQRFPPTPSQSSMKPGEQLSRESVLVTGVRADSARFAILSPRTIPIVLKTRPGIDLANSDALLLGFDLGTWLSGTDLSVVPLDSDGFAVLDGTVEPDAVAVFENQIPAGAAIYRDVDGDGALDPEELSEPLTE